MSGIWADAIRYPTDSTRPDPAKFVSPRLPANYVARTRLLELLDNCARARVTVVCAPAGAGKSILLSGWSARNENCAWITLDDRDNNPATLSANLSHALEGSFESDVTYLVLDCAEALTASAAHELLPRIANALPPSVHLLVASRSRSPLALHRLRLEQDAIEVNSRELRFTVDEATELIVDPPPTSVDVATLVEHVDGWATGLFLALSGRSAADAESAAREFLREQVLAKQPEDIQRFLTETAFLEYLSAAASERITKRPDAVDVLRQLEGETAFLSSVEGDHLRYAYQRQFRDMLRDELRARNPERVDAVNVASARWCEQHDHVAEAMEHWLAAGREHDALLLLRTANLRFCDTRPELVAGWVSRIDATSARGDARLLLDLAASFAEIGNDDRFKDTMDRVGVVLRGSPDPVLETRSSLLRARLAFAAGDVESHVAWLERAQATLSTDQQLLDHPTLAMLPRARRLSPWLALGQFWLERTDDARATLRDRPYAPVEDAVDRLFVRSVAAAVSFGEGNLEDALALALNATDTAERLHVNDYVVWPAAHVLAATLHERGNIAAALVAFEDFTRTTREPSGNTFSIAAEVGLASVFRSRGDLSEALDRLSRLRRDHLPDTHPATQGWVDREMALTLLQLGQVRAAGGVLGLPQHRDSETLVAALIELAHGDAMAALRLSTSVRRDQPRSMLLAALIEAQAAKLRGDHAAVIAAAGRAMRVAQRYGFIRSVLDFGSELLPEFAAVSAGAADAEFVAQLRRSQRHSPATIDLREPGALSVELTDRELEVLRYLPTHLTIREIARELYVSHNTVKSHAQHLYRKLGVDSREAAVERARSLQVLR
jgi:LuxR family maltose regulon positive regulatory protein